MESAKENNRLTHIDLLESIAIFFVMIYHTPLCSVNFLEGSKWHYLAYLLQTILSTCVPIFFFANGYLLFGKNFNLKKHIEKMIRLVVLTVIWGAINLLLLQVIEGQYFSIGEFVNALLEWKQGWINHLWYMAALVCIYVFFPLLKHVYDTNKKIFIYFIIICAVFTFGNTLLNEAATIFLQIIGSSSVAQTVEFFNRFNPFRGIQGYSFVYFCVGGLMHSFENKIECVSARKRNVIAVLGIIIACMGLWGIGICYSIPTNQIWDVVWNGYDTIFTFCNVIFIFILCKNWNCNQKFVRTVSCNTLGIYFIHEIFIHLIHPYVEKAEILCNIPFNIIYAFGIMCISFAVSVALKKIPVLSRLV